MLHVSLHTETVVVDMKDSQTTSESWLVFLSVGLSDRALNMAEFCTLGLTILGHETAVVGASRSSNSSSTDALVSLEAAERLQSEIENPGALSDVSKAPLRILTGLMFQAFAMESGQRGQQDLMPCCEIPS